MPTPSMPMSVSLPSSSSDGFALVCARDGSVRRIVRATLSGVDLRDPFCASVDAPSEDACATFIGSIARGGFARSTPLRLGSRDVQCFGFSDGDDLRIVGVIDPIAGAPFAELVGIEDDPAFLRVAEEIRRTHSTYELYEELARLNNELVTAQRELARTVAELQRLNAYKDELLGMAAHDLRNPLNANAAFITFLLDDSESIGDNNLVLLERLKSNSDYMLRLVENVLDFSAIQSGKVRLQSQPTPLEELVMNVLQTMRILAEPKGVEVRASLARSLPTMYIDRIKITQALQNLVSNAVQYSPSGTEVDVRVRIDGAVVVFEVEDHGPGIPATEMPELFKPFTRLSTVKLGRQRSVGLGLAITK
ncbi:MAG TPA: HAMP domain-containing sensor histidine kinase, partial [Thermoanaerobaculia bacterium]